MSTSCRPDPIRLRAVSATWPAVIRAGVDERNPRSHRKTHTDASDRETAGDVSGTFRRYKPAASTDQPQPASPTVSGQPQPPWSGTTQPHRRRTFPSPTESQLMGRRPISSPSCLDRGVATANNSGLAADGASGFFGGYNKWPVLQLCRISSAPNKLSSSKIIRWRFRSGGAFKRGKIP